MGQRTLVPDAGEVVLHELKAIGRDRLVMVLRSTGERSRCPVCDRASGRIHSRYARHLSDLPWEGIPVRIELQVRRFFCDSDDCPQRIFTERLPQTAPRYARRTSRLSRALEQITLALGGSAGSRLAEQLGILASDSTLLRQLRRKTIATATSPRVLGIDDWAWRKGQRYGTILCDLERRTVVDLLPDRSTESTERWLRAHPGTELISRDRASLYAQAATNAAPQAMQVADRWHLLHNMTEALMEALGPHHGLLNEAALAAVHVEATPQQAAQKDEPVAPVITRARQRQQQNRQRRLERYDLAMEKAREGLSQREIARQTGLSRKTIRRYLKADQFPERKRGLRHSSVEAHREFIEQRWLQGCHNAAQLWRELQTRGFAGRPHTLRDWLQKQYGRKRERVKQRTPRTRQPRISPRKATWDLLKEPPQAKPFLDELYRRSPQIAALAQTAREFFRIIRERDAAAWPEWQQSAAAGPLAGFAKHLRRDEAAFLAALQQPWSNGPVEGQVHRLKLIKRSMYGRASFDLLRIRVLRAA
jgi:transposase